MFFEPISADGILFFILYGVTGVVPFIAALYLLLRKGNAFAPDVTPPLLLRRWAASFFVMAALGHVWWLLFYLYSHDLHSVDDYLHSAGYVVIVILDYVTQFTAIAGTLLAMLQDRKRPVWPVFVATLPFAALGGVFMVNPSEQLMLIVIAYTCCSCLVFTIYMVFSVRQYGRWLRDNYADLERKEVWQTHVAVFFFILLFFLYTFVEVDSDILFYFLHLSYLLLFVLLLWRVETLPQLDGISSEKTCTASVAEAQGISEAVDASEVRPQSLSASPVNIALVQIEQLLAEHCVDTQLYLQHDLSLHQLALAIGTNRSYLSQYFSSRGITYNTYINNLRINHFINRYQAAAIVGQPVTAQQLASESGYRSYSTFSLAFKQRTGLSVTAWMRNTEG